MIYKTEESLNLLYEISYNGAVEGLFVFIISRYR